MISKSLLGILEFSQKTNERIRRSSKNEFVRSFFGGIRGYQKSFRNYVTFSFPENYSFLELEIICCHFISRGRESGEKGNANYSRFILVVRMSYSTVRNKRRPYVY
jgi:hypothetical protein